LSELKLPNSSGFCPTQTVPIFKRSSNGTNEEKPYEGIE